MAINASLKSTETRDEPSTTCNPKVMSRCLPPPDATYPGSVVLFQFNGGMVSHMQVLATPSSNVNST